MKFSVGFTGTQRGMSKIQAEIFGPIWEAFAPKVGEVHLGDCIGADAEIYALVKRISPHVHTVGHIPNVGNKRAFCKYDEELPAQSYLVRNKAIVSASAILIAFPGGAEVLRSGTWSTVRFARKFRKPILLIYPDGFVHREGVWVFADSV